MAITEEKTETVVVADAKVTASGKIKVTVNRDLTVDESKKLRKLLKEQEAAAQCPRNHNGVFDALAYGNVVRNSGFRHCGF